MASNDHPIRTLIQELRRLHRGPPGKERKMILYFYGMRNRGFSIGCQPGNVYERYDSETPEYHDIIAYTSELSDYDLYVYELDYLFKMEV